MENEYLVANIPGMIEVVEQRMLEGICKNAVFEENEIAVEFGAFFGRSTASLLFGLLSNDTYRCGGQLYVYDSFECDLKGGFYPSVYSFAKQFDVVDLLDIKGESVNFFPVFEYYLGKYINSGDIVVEKCELIDSFHKGGKIKVLHVDSPKCYREFKIVLYRFFPHLRKGSVIIFQDFFYQWSATLVAACGLMMKGGFLTPVTSAASSLVCMVNRDFDEASILEVDLIMERDSLIPELIDAAGEAVDKFELDRKVIFRPRLALAKVQWLFERGNYKAAADEVVRFVNIKHEINPSVISDFIEVMGKGFCIRRLYELDHKI